MVTNEIPVLKTSRLSLRRLLQTDSKALYSYFSKDEVTEFYDLFTFKEEREALELINIWNTRVENKQGLRWAITLEGSDKLIGTCGFHNFSIENNRAEIGYDLHPDYWGKGLMTEAISCLIKYGFEILKLHRIEAFIDPCNHASRRLLQKNGLEVEGILRDYFYEKERFVDAEMLSIINK